MGEYADESVVDVASSATMVKIVLFIIQKCFVLMAVREELWEWSRQNWY